MNFFDFLKTFDTRNIACKARFFPSTLVLIAMVLPRSLFAASTIQMTLAEMAKKSAHIVVGKCLESQSDFVSLPGGGKIPVMRYRFQVDESIKGATNGVFEIRMLAAGPVASGNLLRYRFSGVPVLQPGNQYVLLLTRESSLGLSATIGLQQGCFAILPKASSGARQRVVNGLQNAGLAISSKNANAGINSTQARPGPVKILYLDEFISVLRELVQ